MSRAHPIVAVTGASGAGTTNVQKTFKSICGQEKYHACFVEGDSFHKYDRDAMRQLIDAWERTAGRSISHFGPEANLLNELETLFSNYGMNGTGQTRQYLHNDESARTHGQKVGTFTEWTAVDKSDLLIYEGLHGGIITDEVNVAQHVDLLIGITPTINLEWIQKLHRDQRDRGHTVDDVTQTILRRMPDYIEYIVPQFSRTHINFQRVPTVDTSNPFSNTGIPSAGESLIVVRFNDPNQQEIDDIINGIGGSFQTKDDCIVVPGQSFEQTLALVITPRLNKLILNSQLD
jgi:phosphoribulokinase